MATPAEILEKIELYILTGGRRTLAVRLRQILDDISNLLGGGGSSTYSEEIECDGGITSYTITHNKNTFSPVVSLYFLVLDTGVGYDAWQPLDITQGIYVNSTDPDTLFFNPMVYYGNDNGFKYKIRII